MNTIYNVKHTEGFDISLLLGKAEFGFEAETDEATLVTVPEGWCGVFELWCNGNDVVTSYDIVPEVFGEDEPSPDFEAERVYTAIVGHNFRISHIPYAHVEYDDAEYDDGDDEARIIITVAERHVAALELWLVGHSSVKYFSPQRLITHPSPTGA